jgi:hypothetical protein
MEPQVRSIADRSNSPGWGVWLAPAVVIAASIEFVTLRVLVQSGPALESGRATRILLEGLLLLGLTALTAGVILAIVLIASISTRFISTGDPSLVLLGSAGITLVAVLALAVIPFGPRSSLLLPSMALSIVALSSVVFLRMRSASVRVPVTLFGVTGLMISAHFLTVASGAGPVKLSSGMSFLHFGEMLVLVAGAAALILVRRPISRWAFVSGISAGGFLLAWQTAMPWLPSTVAIWNFGVSTFLPAPAYALILGMFTLAVVQLLRQDFPLGAALVLIALGGLKWDVPYFHLLGVAGLLLLVDSLRTQAPTVSSPIELAPDGRMGLQQAGLSAASNASVESRITT